MDGKNKKQKTNHVVIVTSDAIDAGVHKFKIRPWILELIILLLCAVIGALIGYFFFEEKSWEAAIEKSNAQLHMMEELQKENEQVKQNLETREQELTERIQTLDEEVQILSATLNQKVQSEEALTKELEAMNVPTRFPLNGSASSFEVNEAAGMVAEIVSSEGVMVVATAGGTVLAVNDDLEYGHNVWVDHGNGYISIYRNQGSAVVKQGDVIYQGTTIFIVEEDNTKLGYQIMLDGEYINPVSLIDIKG